ncbi:MULTISPECIES: hypothetical protein [Streptomycetaceae]|uniref:hypothetical protein n=1 Tax=Streptomycetaceae TaxID=2062 RepID=UPI00093E7DE3|nr:hypothetical protein [Streptomyces sp. CB02056]OKI06439.1 hypothetical protein AMK13_17810 [Streptomyces sp. CB02056]
MTTILSPPTGPVPAPQPAAPRRAPADPSVDVSDVRLVPDLKGGPVSHLATDAPTTKSPRRPPGPATRARGAEPGDPVETFMWTLWLLGNVLVIALVGMLVDHEVEHQGVAHGQAPTRSAPDVGET